MADTIEHRGPDDEGYYASGPVGFGFRRLAIIDLNTGHQPISNEDGSVWIVFNGEIYNYRELRELLKSKGHVFKTQTDTEVIVHLYEEFGEEAVAKLRGMFGFAIWDERTRTLLLARDRVGIKPLYYAITNQALVFASEIKAILADKEVQPELDEAMIDRFLTHYFLPGEETAFRNVRKLPPGSYMVVQDGQTQVRQYWDVNFSPQDWSLDQAKRELLSLLEESVQLHMISDVPVGFLLSGGVDSTALLALTAGKAPQRLSTFTLGFSSPGLADERPYAQLAAKKYGVEHHEMTILAEEFAAFLPKFAWHMEEPVCEPQAVALYYVSRLAKDFVKVLISGEGGDEAFAGYQTYRGILWLERLKKISGPLRGPLSSLLSFANRFFETPRLTKYVPLMGLRFEDYFYSRRSSAADLFNCAQEWLYSPEFACHVDKKRSLAPIRQFMSTEVGGGHVNRMLYMDMKTSLPDDLLLKADKMTMANSVELRVPLLDHKLLEFAASLPENFKVRGFTTKFIAKEVLRNHVPREILERKKAGFPVPYEQWLRYELRSWVADILLDRETASRGYFKTSAVEQMIRENSRTGGYSRELLSLVTLEHWHRAFLREKDWGFPDSNKGIVDASFVKSKGAVAAFDSRAGETCTEAH
jgi:asparagine synthase (glutamine-hydrolysing)